ncbi:MAG: thiamine pyrophosphate-binding protein [Coriobacteriia bacterium]
MIKVSDYIARRIAELGVGHVFLVTGGGAMHLNDSLGACDGLSLICNHHEQACAIGAEGYARVSGGMAVVCVTTGPGGTNAMTGVLGQWHDSVPVLYVSGQVRYDTTVASTSLPLRQLGDQEADIVSMVSPITKYAVMVSDPLTIRYHFERAVHLAISGRPGPVWLDIPLNVQAAVVDEAALMGYDPIEDLAVCSFDEAAVQHQVAETIRRLQRAERPVILAGSGIRTSGSLGLFLKLAERLHVPVATAWNAHDVLWEEHPLYAGRPGTVGDRAGNFAVQNSDFLLVLGCRLNVRQVSYEFPAFAHHAFRVMVDVDQAELVKPTLSIDLPIHSELRFFLEAMEDQIRAVEWPDRSEWATWCAEWRRRYPVVRPEFRAKDEPVNPYVFVDELSDAVNNDDIVVCANGAACVIGFQALRLKRGMRLIGNSGTASMGYDVPAAIGAAVAAGRRVICLAGDGSIQMNIQELQTIVHHQLPVKIFVFNNEGYLSIRQTQDNLFGGHYVGESARSGVSFPDMVRVASAYGIEARRVASHEGLTEAIRATLISPGPAVLDVVMDPSQNFEPKLMAQKLPDGRLVSKPLEDMYPFLDREEFASNMLVPPYQPQSR